MRCSLFVIDAFVIPCAVPDQSLGQMPQNMETCRTRYAPWAHCAQWIFLNGRHSSMDGQARFLLTVQGPSSSKKRSISASDRRGHLPIQMGRRWSRSATRSDSVAAFHRHLHPLRWLGYAGLGDGRPTDSSYMPVHAPGPGPSSRAVECLELPPSPAAILTAHRGRYGFQTAG